jgi:hypothetical protein
MAFPEAVAATGSLPSPKLQIARTPLLSVRALSSAVVLATAVSLAVTAFVLFALGGLDYYSTPTAIRGYHPAHRLLRPSGPIGQSFGVAGAILMLVPFAYMVGKRVLRGRAAGSIKGLLELHIFCGIVGPVLVTFHTSLKFNGIVSVAYWSMVLVSLSGFVGRHLYVRMPRTIRGVELTRDEIEARAADLREQLLFTAPPRLIEHLDRFERETSANAADASWPGALAARARLRRARRVLLRTLVADGSAPADAVALVTLVVDRAWLQHRLAGLHQTRRLFMAWHVFHLPLVYLMFVIVLAHVGLSLYMGYVPFRW